MAEYDWRIAGYGTDEGWFDVEAGDPEPSDEDLLNDHDFTVAFRDENGVDHYRTMHGPADPNNLDDLISEVISGSPIG